MHKHALIRTIISNIYIGFSGVLRLTIKQAAQLAGMQYSGALTKHTNVVIAAHNINPDHSAKLQTALRHGIPIVHPQWLADTIAAGNLQPTKRYRPTAYPTCTPPGARDAPRHSYTSIELEVLRYTASPAVHDPRTLASVLRAARLIDAATQPSPANAPHTSLALEQPPPSPDGLHQDSDIPCTTPAAASPPHLLVRVGPCVPTPPRALLHAVHERHGSDCQPRFHSSVQVLLPDNHTLRFEVHGSPRVPLVLPDGADDSSPAQLAPIRLEGVYDLDGVVWLVHCYYLDQSDLQGLPGGPIDLAPHELVLRRKLYHSPAASIRGAALVFGRRGACMRRLASEHDAAAAVYFCERIHAG